MERQASIFFSRSLTGRYSEAQEVRQSEETAAGEGTSVHHVIPSRAESGGRQYPSHLQASFLGELHEDLIATLRILLITGDVG